MPTTDEYIEQFGDVSFDERPFCDADAIALCEIVYMPIELAVTERFTDEPVTLAKAAEELFRINNYKNKKLGLFITAAPGKKIMKMSKTKRFGEMKITAAKALYSKNPAIQFGAFTFIMPNGNNIIVFRGTNDDIAGWKEDADLFCRKKSPSYDLANEYLCNAAEYLEGNFTICGHSKGGNIALYIALTCSEEIRKRICGVYNNDGPGYYNHEIFKTGSYEEILPHYRHIIPSSSLIGVLLAHDYDFIAVKSNKHIGLLQHDMGTWQIKDGAIEAVYSNDKVSKTMDLWLAHVFTNVAANHSCEALDEMLTVITDGIGAKTLTDFSHSVITSIKEGIGAYKTIPGNVKKSVKSSLSGSLSLLTNSISTVNKKADIKELTYQLFSRI